MVLHIEKASKKKITRIISSVILLVSIIYYQQIKSLIVPSVIKFILLMGLTRQIFTYC
jgi:hypothetical protein